MAMCKFLSLSKMAGRKRPRSSLDSSTDSTNKHKVGYSALWKKTFRGMFLSMIVLGVLSLVCCVHCVSSRTRSSETA